MVVPRRLLVLVALALACLFGAEPAWARTPASSTDRAPSAATSSSPPSARSRAQARGAEPVPARHLPGLRTASTDLGETAARSAAERGQLHHNIVSKRQRHDVVSPGGATVPQKKTSYDFAYTYGGPRPHAATQIGDRTYSYDASGNQRGWDALDSGQSRSIDWDEEHRIQAIHDNGRTTSYKYDAAGERVLKRGEQGETAYVNQFWTVRNRTIATKHVFAGAMRVASKLIPGEEHIQPGNPGDPYFAVLGQWWLHRSQQGWQNGENVNQNPHYAGASMPDLLPEDNFAFFYHPDHLGSTEWVTDRAGELYEHVQYFPYGDVWVNEHENVERLPYLFTGKELDEETGLYYFGARYYDPQTSVWQSTDPALSAFMTSSRAGHGAYRPPNLALYSYVHGSPVRFSDPSGLQPVDWQNPTYAGVSGSPGYAPTGDFESASKEYHEQVSAMNSLTAVVVNVAAAVSFVGEVAAVARATVGFVRAVQAQRMVSFAVRAEGALAGTGAGVARAATAAGGGAVVASTAGASARATIAEAVGGGAAEGGEALALQFSQRTASPAFSAEGTFAGKTIGGVAADLRAGTVAASDVPVRYVNFGVNNLIVNARSALALSRIRSRGSTPRGVAE